MFTTKCSENRIWAPRGNEFKPSLKKTLGFKSVAIVGTTNLKRETSALNLNPKSIDKDAFLLFLEKFRWRNPSPTLTLVLNNLPMHYIKRVARYCVEHNICLVFPQSTAVNITQSSHCGPTVKESSDNVSSTSTHLITNTASTN
jgi:hypothetical protein